MAQSVGPSEGAYGDASATVIGDDRPARRRELELPRGSQVGRYVVLARLGAGAMGVVVAAYDPELDRKVALKLLHPREDRRAEVGQRRLLAEAQALARLSDPNVVAVHDVGVHEGHVFVAMEFVAGQTLEAWLAAAPRPWPEVLDVMIRAGRGLAAAHARELVHRDFKPSNVMIGDDGRVRVMDFGLARVGVDATSPDDTDDTTRPRERALGLQLTQFGAIVGTPAYMAPEQLAGGRGDPAVDQFSFCASLWEALHGQRPFVDDTLAGLQARILQGEISKPPAGRRVPRWLRRIVERGLAVDPARRFSSMQALLDALVRGRARARRGPALVALGVLALAGAGVVGGQRWDEHRRVRACEAEGASIAAVWNEDVDAAMREAMLGTGVARAATTAEKVRPWLDAQAQRWQVARTEVCLDAEVRAAWDADTADRAAWCLDTRRVQLEAIVESLRSGDVRAVDVAVGWAASLEPMDACRDPQALARQPTPPPEGREAVRAVMAETLRAWQVLQFGQPDEALALARSVTTSAEALGWPPLVAVAHYREGQIRGRMGAYAEAEALLERAYFEALRADALTVAIEAAARLVYLVGYDLARRADALRWSEHEDVLIGWVGDPTGVYTIQHYNSLSAVHFAAGEMNEVVALQQRLVPLQERVWGPEHPHFANTLNNLANAYYHLGRHGEARELYLRALAIEEQVYGPEHPWISDKLDNLGLVAAAQGEHDEARGLHERALAIREPILGPRHPKVAASLNNLGLVLDEQGRFDEAIAVFERARSIWEEALGPEHPDVALVLNNLALAHGHAGRLEQAAALYRRAIATREASVGLEHPDLATPLQGLASLFIDLGRPAEAVPLAERALRLREVAGLGPDLLAPIHFVLARALWEANQDRTRALYLAGRAVAEHRERGEVGAAAAALVEAWLKERSTPPPRPVP